MSCNHSGYHSGGMRLLLEAHQLQLMLVCDSCGAERAQLGTIDYAPSPATDGVAGGAQGESSA